MSSTRAIVALLAGTLLVSACATRDGSYYPSQTATPMNHPAPPKRRPEPPAAFLAGLADGKSLSGSANPQVSAVGLASSNGSAAGSVTRASVSAIEVQPLAARTSNGPEQRSQTSEAPASVDNAPAPADVTSSQGGSQYRVKKGDSLYGISRRFSVPLRSLADANGLSAPYSLSVSQVLVIPGQERQHRVAKGETVYGIARTYGVEMTAFVAENALSAPYSISPGQTLRVPAAGATGGSGNATTTKAPSQSTQVALSSKSETPVAAETAPAARPAKAKIPAPPALAGGKFLWPIEGKVVGTYGASSDGRRNDGINIIAPRGAPVRAVENGVVAYAGDELRGFGRLLLVKHADGWVTAYAHNDTLLVQRGDIVKRGQPIAKVGSSGNVASPQLHFEIRKGSRAVDPRQLLEPSKIASAN